MTATQADYGEIVQRQHPTRSAKQKHAALVGTPLLAVGIALAAANLRPAVTSAASVLGEVRDDVGASAMWASALTAVPVVCFGLAAVFAPWLERRLGAARAVGLALAVLTGGLALRIVDGQYAVLGGTFVAAAGIAVGNVLIPVVVKGSFPHAIGRVTGIYTAALSAGGGIGAFTPALEPFVGGWRGALGAWAALSAAALIVWLFGARHGSHDEAPVTHERPRRSMLRSPLAWVVTLFFGMQACFAYILMGWLAEFFVAHGIARTEAGLMLAFINLIGIPLSFVIPVYALNRPSQSGWVIALACFSLAGVAGLAVAPAAAPWLWTVLLGIGMSMFPIALGVIALRTRETSETTVLSAMVQGYGYLIAASGPFMFGMLHAATGNWTVPLVLLDAVIIVEGVLGYSAGRPRFV